MRLEPFRIVAYEAEPSPLHMYFDLKGLGQLNHLSGP